MKKLKTSLSLLKYYQEHPEMGVHLSEARKKYYAEHPGCKAGSNHNRYGKKHSEETKRKMSEARKEHYELNPKERQVASTKRKEYLEMNPGILRGANHPSWKGGITNSNHLARHWVDQEQWIKDIFKRDDFTCQFCRKRSNGELNAHHIFFFAKYPDLRMNPDNGITFCKPCHKVVHKCIGFE